MALVYVVASLSFSNNNDLVTLADPAPNGSSGDPGGAINSDIIYSAAGDTNNDGNLDSGETFQISFDGGQTYLTATVDYNYDPRAAPDSELLIFTVDDGNGPIQYAYNVGLPGETDPYKIPGGLITQGMANQGTLGTTSDVSVVCFVRGSLIDTPAGAVAVETLAVGDIVSTVSSGDQIIRWTGCIKAKASGALAPVRIKSGALGENVPSQDLLVSPAHRMMISGWRAELLFDKPEILVPAKALVNDDTIAFVQDLDVVEYYHIMFDKHEIVMSNGAPSESFQPTTESLNHLEQETRDELLLLFPELENGTTGAIITSALPTLSYTEAALLR